MKNIATFLGAFFVASFILLAGNSAAADAKNYINGIDANYPPFGYVNEKGEPDGFDVASMNWIAKEMGFTVTHRPMDWDGIIPALRAKKIDMVASGMSISPARLAQVTFSNPYWQIRKVYVAKKDSTLDAKAIQNGKIILGVQRGTNEADIVLESQKKDGYNYTLRYYDSGPLAIEDVLVGRIKAVAMDSAPAEDAIAHGKPVKIVGELGVVDDFGVALRKGDTELKKLINEGYVRLMADPYWKELQKKYLEKK